MSIKGREGTVAETGTRVETETDTDASRSLRISAVFQEDRLCPTFSPLENVMMVQKGKSSDFSMEEIRTTMCRLLPEECLNRPVSTLSGGMKRRTAILRALLTKSDMLLLDEPFGALDVITRNDMQDWLLQLRKNYNRTTLLVTHDIDEALYLSDRILVLSNKPSHILQEIDLSKEKKSRDWLFSQSDLKKQVYELLKGENHA